MGCQEVDKKMNEDAFNMSLRKFLKQVGVTSQREIEAAVRQGLEDGTLSGKSAITARVTLSLEGLDLQHVVESRIDLE